MVKIQLDLEDVLNKEVEIYKAQMGLNDKRDAIKDILTKYFHKMGPIEK